MGFADDLKLFKIVQNESDALDLQKDINSLAVWSQKWKMTLNYSKCVVLTITLKRKPLNTTYNINSFAMAAVKTHRDLGVIFDSKMTFNPHIDNIVSCGRRMIGMMKRFGKGLSVRALITVYVSFVRPKLEYASIIWNSVGRVKSDKLETVQRDFFKYISFIDNSNYRNVTYEDNCKSFILPSLSKRRSYFDLLFLFKSVNNVFNCQPFFNLHIRGRNTRQSRTFHQTGGRVKVTQQCLFNRIPILYNNTHYSLQIFNTSSLSFKRCARKACF